MLIELILGLVIAVLVYAYVSTDPERLMDIYSQPGKWYHLKKFLFYIFLSLRQYKVRRNKSTFNDRCSVASVAVLNKDTDGTAGREGTGGETANPGYGVRSRHSYEDMDCAQVLNENEYAIDCMYFNGLNADGAYIITRVARRHNRQAEIWLSVNVPGVGFYQSPVHPDTCMFNVDGESFSVGGLTFECLVPMKRWKITYSGLLRKGMHNEFTEIKSDEICHVRFSFVWSAFSDPFDFDVDIHPGCLASAVAREPWSKAYFDRLKESHQTHYEQWGELIGVFQAEGHEEQKLFLRGYRDHSYGVRDWYSFHRYAINFAYLESGMAFHVDSISLPDTLSLLQCGYVSMPNGIMHPVTWTDMDMIALGENQNPPKQYSFHFSAARNTM